MNTGVILTVSRNSDGINVVLCQQQHITTGGYKDYSPPTAHITLTEDWRLPFHITPNNLQGRRILLKQGTVYLKHIRPGSKYNTVYTEG